MFIPLINPDFPMVPCFITTGYSEKNTIAVPVLSGSYYKRQFVDTVRVLTLFITLRLIRRFRVNFSIKF